ncbi:50S ribosomal protein L4 [Oceanibaculum nanhaiense]|jgi:large subunit ribosomal protein L4|uniref:50S ribosomal protein L4 n=1 Tax=Oceanibaculum nanhaiense TaxID=1909734 RepID=UPI000A3D4204|nr:50S ribosomal protein L4 [Oceanibaculum nanhaiense]MBC7134611.1 50S ribosomal protein L4 [Oceanibaculum nanhaiense]MDM7946659.1 50S ribosomal protein L4 [Oceanibaculum nanhaiense]
MKVTVKNLEAADVGAIELDEAIFGVDVRADLLSRVVHWQLAKRRSGNHKTKGISEIAGTTKKPYKQKGTGRARQGSTRSPQFRGGATIFGPVVRDHGYDLPKKVRKLGLMSALASKLKDEKLIVLDDAKLTEPKTKMLKAQLEKLGITSALIVDGAVDENLKKAASNLIGIDVLPQIGANVYDILRRDTLVLTKNAIEALEARLK